MNNPHLPLIRPINHFTNRGCDSFFEVACTCGWVRPRADLNPTSRAQAMVAWRKHDQASKPVASHA